MWLIVLEALAALFVLVFVVWWTMFSGRQSGEMSIDALAQLEHEQEHGDPTHTPDQATLPDETASPGGHKKLPG